MTCGAVAAWRFAVRHGANAGSVAEAGDELRERWIRAIAIGQDPYVVIRPEGRWHVPGVLEASSKRPVSRPSVDNLSESRA